MEQWCRRSRPARRLGDARSAAEPEAAARSLGGGRRRRTAGESEERTQVAARVPLGPQGPRGRAETAQRGASSWRSEMGTTVGLATAPIPCVTTADIGGVDAASEIATSVARGTGARLVIRFRSWRVFAATAGQRGVLGTRRAEPSCPPQRARQVAASGGGRRAKRAASPCLRARAVHPRPTRWHAETARRAACLRVGRKYAQVPGWRLPPFSRAWVSAVDFADCATRAVSRLRKSKPYAQR